MTPSLRQVPAPNSFVSLFIFYILSYLLLKTMGCLSGCLVSSSSVQKLFCVIFSVFKWSFNEFVGEKVISPSYSSAILGPLPGEDSWGSLGLQGDPTSPSLGKSVLNIHWKDWCWSWNSKTLATWCKELTHWKRPWCWERLKARGEGDDRGWDSWMAPLTQWTWVWVNFGSWWWTGRPGELSSMGLQTVRHDWATEWNWWGKLDMVKQEMARMSLNILDENGLV